MDVTTRREELRAPRRSLWAVLAVLLLAMAVFLVLPAASSPEAVARGEGLSRAGRLTTFMAVLMGGLWLTEAMPIPATSLLPVALFPLMGIASLKDATVPYSHNLIFLFMGGFMLARALERWQLHRRLALRTIWMFGTRPAQLVAGFMAASAFLSMWISNTATVVMLTPTGMSVVDLVRRRLDGDRTPEEVEEVAGNFAAALLLGLAYSASIGGMATLIGTPPNALLASFVEQRHGTSIGFAAWMRLGLPLVIVFLPVCWWLLTHRIFPVDLEEVPGGRQAILDELKALGPVSVAERRLLWIFGLTCAAWIFRPVLDEWLFQGILRPASGGLAMGLNDSSIAILAALSLFLIPSGHEHGERLLDWKTAVQLPWGILLLFGGGLSLAAAMSANGVPAWIGHVFGGLKGVPAFWILLAVTLAVILLTEFTSNTATVATLLPVLAGVAGGLEVSPFLLYVPAVFAASCAFMMPVATPPNAIVLASEQVTVQQLFRAGVWMNGIGVLLITLHVYFLGGWLLGVEMLRPLAH